MKKLLVAVSVLFSLHLQAQDSTQIKLQQYKQWHEQGLIGDDEYLKAKSKLLGLPTETAKPKEERKAIVSASTPVLPKQQPTVDQKWKSKYTGKLAGGSVLMVIGGGLFFGGMAIIPINAARPIESRIPTAAIYTMMGAGALSMCAGGILIGSGLKDKRNKPTVSLLISDKISLCCNF